MTSKGNAPGDEPRAINENSADGDIFYPNYSILGKAGKIERTPDPETAAEYCDLMARIWNTRGDLARLELERDAYGETPGIDYLRGENER
jgi:hypothetical protein